MCSKFVTVDCPPHPEEGEADLIFISQTAWGVNSTLLRHWRYSSGWILRHNSRDLGNQKTRKESLRFHFSCVNFLLGLGPVSDPISLKVRNSGSCGFIQKAGIWGEASQIPGCLDLGLGLDPMIYYVAFWGYLTVFSPLEKIKSKVIMGPVYRKISRNVEQIISLLSYKQDTWNHTEQRFCLSRSTHGTLHHQSVCFCHIKKSVQALKQKMRL